MEFGMTQGVVALLVILAAIIPFFLKRKQIWPFKPRTKKINELQVKFEKELDEKLLKKEYAHYLDNCDNVLDERERLRQQEKSDKRKTDK